MFSFLHTYLPAVHNKAIANLDHFCNFFVYLFTPIVFFLFMFASFFLFRMVDDDSFWRTSHFWIQWL